MTHTTKQQQGFALLIGVVISAILVSITYTMFSISLKQIMLSTAGRNSQVAFYMADTGAECALYADMKIEGAFVVATVSDVGDLAISAPAANKEFMCNDSQISYTSTKIGTNVKSEFTVNSIKYPEVPACAKVTVTKFIDNGVVKTSVESRGYNTCVNNADPQRLERGLEVHY